MRYLIGLSLWTLLMTSCICIAEELRPPAVLGAAPISSVVSKPGAQVAASNDGSTVAIKISQEATSLPEDPTKDGTVSFSWRSLTAEAPISKSENSHNLFSLDGLGNATTIGISYSQFRTHWQPAEPQKAIVFKKICEDMRQAAAIEMGKTAAVEHKSAEDVAKAANALDCSASNFAKYLPAHLDDARQGLSLPALGGFLWGVAAKYGIQNSDFFDETTLIKKTEHHSPWSANFFIGWNPEGYTNTFLLFKAERKSSYKDADSTTRCPVINGAVALTCTTGSFGAPELEQGKSVSIEARHVIDKSIAAALIVSRDASENVTTVELPVYWLGSDKGALNGGVKFGWDSKEKKWGAGVFVGIPFVLWSSGN